MSVFDIINQIYKHTLDYTVQKYHRKMTDREAFWVKIVCSTFFLFAIFGGFALIDPNVSGLSGVGKITGITFLIFITSLLFGVGVIFFVQRVLPIFYRRYDQMVAVPEKTKSVSFNPY